MSLPVDKYISFEVENNQHRPFDGADRSYFHTITFRYKKNKPIKAIVSCIVTLITGIVNSKAIAVRSGNYCITYCTMKNIIAKKRDKLNCGDILGLRDDLADDDNALELIISGQDNKELLPSK